MNLLILRIKVAYLYLYLLCISICLNSCDGHQNFVANYIPPAYKSIQLVPTSDSLHFHLHASTYNNIRSFNNFVFNGKDYIAFYDKQSASVNLYDLNSKILLKRFELKPLLPYKDLEKRTTVFYKNLDSIFIINHLTLYLLDNQLSIKDTVDFQISPIAAFSFFGAGTPPVFRNNKMYLSADPYLSKKNKREYKKWKTLYEVDLKKNTTKLLVGLPKTYLDSFYGNYFFDVNYCFNGQNKIVFSFAADSSIYETDLQDYNVSYSAKSIYHKSGINAVSKEEMKGEEWKKKTFLLRDSYSKIFFDPYRKRYLRIAEHKLTEQEYASGKKQKQKSIIFLDKDFRVIGESTLSVDLPLTSLLFTQDGRMYTRTKFEDEYGLHFVRLEYREDTPKTKLAFQK